MSVKIQDVADEVWREIGEPSDITTASISYWLQTNVGLLNNNLQCALVLNKQDLEIESLGEDEKSILKLMYSCHFYNKKFIETMGAAGVDQIIEVQTDGHKVRKVNKNELSKTYLNAKTNCQNELKSLSNGYRNNRFGPIQVAGDDTIVEGQVRIVRD
jgi:hypothetical protein